MITRVEGGLTYTQTFDAENRLISVTVSGQTTQFLYNGDGNLVKKTKPDGSKTLYVGGIYEVDKTSGGTVTKTTVYYPGGAMRINGTLYYVLKDHLGSASVVTDSTGAIVGEQRYYPFGETRLTTGSMFTDKLYTSQREVTGLGIYHYGSRFYSPKLGRFLSADTIVPGAANPQNFNRYSYVRNNPVRYTDPTGHAVANEVDGGIPCYPGELACFARRDGGTVVKNKPSGSNGNTNIPSVTTGTPLLPVVIPNSTPQPGIATSTSSSIASVTVEPSSTPNPFATVPTICPTPFPGEAPCTIHDEGRQPSPSYSPFGWDSSLVPWDEVALDGAGLLADAIPILQPPAMVAEGAKIFSNVLDVAELYLDANDFKPGNPAEIDVFNVLLDFGSFVPEFGAAPSGIGLFYNLSKGIVLK